MLSTVRNTASSSQGHHRRSNRPCSGIRLRILITGLKKKSYFYYITQRERDLKQYFKFYIINSVFNTNQPHPSFLTQILYFIIVCFEKLICKRLELLQWQFLCWHFKQSSLFCHIKRDWTEYTSYNCTCSSYPILNSINFDLYGFMATADFNDGLFQTRSVSFTNLSIRILPIIKNFKSVLLKELLWFFFDQTSSSYKN